MTVVNIHFPVEMKRQLDRLRQGGFSIAGFVRKAVENELARTAPAPRKRNRRVNHG